MSVLPPITSDAIDADQIRTFKEFLINYNKVSELCFTDCVNDFTSRNVKGKEEKCAYTCMEKFLKTNQRISQRFSEFQMLANENAMAAAQKMGGKVPS
ncbi:PREDICTED: mitochondrial import inner membrane translocase subunit Tim9-like [Nicrophorus vespilloides]|uniref:Mitochondrial import inner membrane translocase subunit n=1 Tax=Nicrophorus vespilloides TaxID=110193 RepID=A0ABM1N6D4_NICVS|nr:PREDICTED: mitochondrial import inner membrane translocase subunit Tim9-like [Nicrophorus vespilloides]